MARPNVTREITPFISGLLLAVALFASDSAASADDPGLICELPIPHFSGDYADLGDYVRARVSPDGKWVAVTFARHLYGTILIELDGMAKEVNLGGEMLDVGYPFMLVRKEAKLRVYDVREIAGETELPDRH